MDPANFDTVRQAISSQGAMLGQHQSSLQGIMASLDSLSNSIAAIQAHISAPPQPPVPSPSEPVSVVMSMPDHEPQVPTPERYDGHSGRCRSFLIQVGLVFEQQPRSYRSERAKISYIIGLLRGEALEWASAVWEKQGAIAQSCELFTAEMRKIFDHPVRGKDASKRLLSLRQGTRSVADYSIEFRILAAESGWDEEALQGVFYNGLNEGVKDSLLSYPEVQGLEELICLTT
uniref:Retrotransposon gag domain-containing protein n=1 Tax=Gasterosteus aculeatus aculeatus TaxID=481459 RepID=A0AAQ4RRK4_GASAC